MKTLTELSGSLVRMAAKAITEAKRLLPKEDDAPTPPAELVSVPPSAEAAGQAPAEAVAAAAAPEAAPSEAPATAEAAPAAEPASAEPPAAGPEAAEPAPVPPAPKAKARPQEEESEAMKAAFDEAVAKATGLSGERLSMLRAAVKAAGRRTDDVRLVRVFGPEEPVSGAASIGGHQYVVDFLPGAMKQVPVPRREDRGRRGGGSGGGRGGGKGAGPPSGGFSMDSLRDDRKGSGPGGRRPGGGGRPGGGRGR